MVKSNVPTIVALSTPRGHSGIAVIRLSGNKSLSIIQKFFKSNHKILPGKAIYGQLYDKKDFIDSAVITFFQSPHSYTGEDLIEISLHGNPYICDLVIDICKKLGAVNAEPGEFTRRAFLNGKMDLSQAEGVADIIFSDSRSALVASTNLLRGKTGAEFNKIKSDIIDIITVTEHELDFQEDEIFHTSKTEIISRITSIINSIDSLLNSYEYGRLSRDGILCPIVGPPNSGKSSLFNAFLHEERVIISPHPGTTRDFIEESVNVGDYQIRFTDTAGIRETKNKVEHFGVKKSIDLLDEGDVLLYVIDSSNPRMKIEMLPPAIHNKTLYVFNKSDKTTKQQINKLITTIKNRPCYVCSAKYHHGIHELAFGILNQILSLKPKSEDVILTRRRHKDILLSVKSFLEKTICGISDNLPPEIYVIDLRESLEHFDTILGKTTNEDILNNIFSHFCIGK